MSWRWAPYKSVANRQRDAEKTIVKLQKQGQKVSPVRVEGIKIASSFWGRAWCDHLESFSDYQSRLPRGRSYVRHGAVIHLEVSNREISALVQGSALYNVSVKIKAVKDETWQAILKKCSGEVSSLIEILQGKFSSAVMGIIIDKRTGLFPLSEEIEFKCSCYDWANMCKHVAAVLYGIGARLDLEPELIFMLRDVDHMELLDITVTGVATSPSKSKIIENQDLSALFGIDIDTTIPQSDKSKKNIGSSKKQKLDAKAVRRSINKKKQQNKVH